MKHVKDFDTYLNESKIEEEILEMQRIEGDHAKNLSKIAGNDQWLTDLAEDDDFEQYEKKLCSAYKKLKLDIDDVMVIGSEGANDWSKCIAYAKSAKMKHEVVSTDDGDWLVYSANESANFMNESKEWFPDRVIDDYINDGSAEWTEFWKKAKKGDIFSTRPNGVEELVIPKSDLGKSKIEADSVWAGPNKGSQGEDGTICTIIDRKKVTLSGGDYDDDKLDVIFYVKAGEHENVYLLPDM